MRSFYIIFLSAILFDIIIIPSSGALAWLPRISLALLPFIFLFGRPRMVQIIFFLSAAFFWLTTNINLGIIVFALGAMFFFEHWVVLRFFHKEAWQTLFISSLGIIVFGFFIFLAVYLVAPQDNFFNIASALSFILTTALAAFLIFFLKRITFTT